MTGTDDAHDALGLALEEQRQRAPSTAAPASTQVNSSVVARSIE